MKVDDPQLSSVSLVMHCVKRVHLICFVNLSAEVVQSLPGVLSTHRVLREEPSVQGKKKKKKKKKGQGHNYPSSSEILVSNSLFFLSAGSTVTLYFQKF